MTTARQALSEAYDAIGELGEDVLIEMTGNEDWRDIRGRILEALEESDLSWKATSDGKVKVQKEACQSLYLASTVSHKVTGRPTRQSRPPTKIQEVTRELNNGNRRRCDRKN